MRAQEDSMEESKREKANRAKAARDEKRRIERSQVNDNDASSASEESSEEGDSDKNEDVADSHRSQKVSFHVVYVRSVLIVYYQSRPKGYRPMAKMKLCRQTQANVARRHTCPQNLLGATMRVIKMHENIKRIRPSSMIAPATCIQFNKLQAVVAHKAGKWSHQL